MFVKKQENEKLRREFKKDQILFFDNKKFGINMFDFGKDINKKPDIQQLKKLIETKKIELERLRNNIDKRNQREIERAKELEKLFKKKNGDD